jgi:histone acetyltransferase (RNA polymerase elongator complex component)
LSTLIFTRERYWNEINGKSEDLARKKGYNEVKVPSGYTSFGFYKKLGYKESKNRPAKRVMQTLY